jgi:hypothetical protein
MAALGRLLERQAAILSASVRAQILDRHVAQHAECEIHQIRAMRPPRIAHLVVLSIHEVKDGESRPNVTRTAVTFSHISGRCAVLPVTPLARILDNPKAVGSQPAAAKVLASLLDKLRSVSARGRRGGLALVRTMTEKGGA